MKRILAHLCVILLLTTAAFADRNIYRLEDTAAERRLPVYLVDVTDGLTEEVGLTTSGSECRISKNGNASADCVGTFGENETGLYYYEPTAGEHDTVGYISVRISDAAARKFIGIANIVAYDPTSGERFIPARAQAQSAGASTLQLAAAETFSDDELNKNTSLHIVSATSGGGQTRCICDYVGSTDTATTCEPWQTTPTGTIMYSLRDAPHCNALQPTVDARTLDVAATGEAGLDFGNTTGTIDAAEIGADAITAAKIAADAIGASEIAAAAITNSEFTATPSVSIDFDVATGTIDAAQIGTDAITAAKIATDAIGASEIAAAAITNSEFTATVSATVDFDTATGTIDAAQIGNDAITAAKIAAGAITGSEFTATPTIGGVNAAALADFFDTSSGTTYAGSVSGSVVKEIADNAAGGGGGGGGACTSIAAGGITAASFAADVVGHVLTAGALTTNTIKLNSAEGFTDSQQLKGHSILVTSATKGRWQNKCVCSYNQPTNTVTICGNWKPIPTGVVKYAIMPDADCPE